MNVRFLLVIGGVFCMGFPFFYSQEKFFAYGVLGTTASQISGDNTHGFGQFGVYAGATIDYELKDSWFLETGLIFNQKGARKYQALGNISTYRLRVNYIDVPILAKYKWKDFSFSLGKAINVKINQRERTDFGEIEDPRIFKPLELSIQGGVNYRLKENWRVQLNYQNSILPVRKHGENYFTSNVPNTIFEEWHQTIVNKGQYFSLFSLFFIYEI